MNVCFVSLHAAASRILTSFSLFVCQWSFLKMPSLSVGVLCVCLSFSLKTGSFTDVEFNKSARLAVQ